tara:strand:+ start:282 stop:458 length:177 start_codon:yes stop_codon:yes gene_type:complete
MKFFSEAKIIRANVEKTGIKVIAEGCFVVFLKNNKESKISNIKKKERLVFFLPDIFIL